MKVLLLIPEGFSEIDTFTVLDILRRSGIEVTTCGIAASAVAGARRAAITADAKLDNVSAEDYGMLILPGGPGYKNLLNSASVMKLIKAFAAQKRYIAAMCEAPLALAKAGVIDDKIVTVYPGLEKQVPRPREAKVIVADNIITCRSSSTATDLALKLVEIAAGKKAAQKTKQEIFG